MKELFKDDPIQLLTMKEILEGRQDPSVLLNQRFIGGIMENVEFRSANSGARIRMLPIDDTDVGIQVIDDDGNDVFKAIISGADVGDVIIGDYDGGQGIKYDKSTKTMYYTGTNLLKTFFQDAIPTSINIGDLWFNTDDNNKPYRASSIGADQIIAGEWVLASNVPEWDDVLDGAITKPDDNADKTSVNNQGVAWLDEAVGSVLPVGNTDAKCTNALADQTSENNAKGIIGEGTAGETIDIGDWIATKCISLKYYTMIDSWIRSSLPDTNYGSATSLYIGREGGDDRYIFIDFTLPAIDADEILTAKLWFKVDGFFGDATYAYLTLCQTAWGEDTITWNNQPTLDTDRDIEYKYGTKWRSDNQINGNGWYSIDMTQIVRHWKDGNVSNYGFKLNVGTATHFHIFSHNEANNPMYLEITRMTRNTTGSKLFKASANDYKLCRNIVGRALSAGNADETISYIVQGILPGSFANVGDKYYLSTAGNVTHDVTLYDRVIKLAEIIGSTQLLLDVQRQNIFIESLIPAFMGGAIGTFGTSHRIYPPIDARRAIIIASLGTNGGAESNPSIKIEIQPGRAENRKVKVYLENEDTVEAEWSETSPGYITITSSGASYFFINEIYFFS